MSSKSAALFLGIPCLVVGAVLAISGTPGDILAGDGIVQRVSSAAPVLIALFGVTVLILAATGRACVANIAVAACSALFIGHVLTYGEWLVDDAAISFTYAKNFAEGHGLVLYPGADPVESYSNPLWVLLLAGGHALGVAFVPLAKILGIATGLGAILIAWHVARRYLGVSAGFAVLVPLLIALNGHYAMWSASGLENPLLALLIMAAVWATVSELERGKTPLVAPLVCALLATVRPESVLYGGAIGLVATILTPRGRRLAHAGRWLALFAAPFALLIGWRYWYFGAFMPNTYYAKSSSDLVASSIRHLWTGPRYLFGAWNEQGAAIFGVVAVFGFATRRNGKWLLLAALAAGVAFVLKAGGDWMGAGRFVAHLTPVWLILVAVGFEIVRRKALSGRYVVLAIIVGTAFYTYNSWQIVKKEAVGRLCPFERVANVGRWYADFADRLQVSDPTLATIDLGGASLFANMRIIDLAGLGNAEVARAMYDGDYGPEFFDEFLDTEQPTFIHIHSGWATNSGIPTLPLISEQYYEMDVPDYLHPARHHFVHRTAFTAKDFDASGVRRMVDDIELFDVKRSHGAQGAGIVVLWRATAPLGESSQYIWEVRETDGSVVASQGLLYGLVPAEGVEIGRVHREFFPVDAAPGDVEVLLVKKPPR